VRQGDAVTPFYDPMIAKVIVHAPTRAAALRRLQGALAECHVAGTVTNLAFLGALARHEGFARGEVDTGLIARDLAALAGEADAPEEATALAALASLGLLREAAGHDPWSRLVGWRHWTEAKQFCALERDGQRIERRVTSLGRGRYVVDGGAAELELSVQVEGQEALVVSADGHAVRARLALSGRSVTVFLAGASWSYLMPDPLEGAADAEAEADVVVSPMPGLVARVAAEAGQTVEKGQALVVVEAMKMELTLRAPRDGTVAEVCVSAGDQIGDGAVVVRMEAASG
jgi:3-methylcrotonyl-CoA carboxylase alpha subunit